MWPMLTGIGPILGDGAVGSFVAADGNITWFYKDGKTGTRNPAGLETVSLTLQDGPVSPHPLRSPFWSTAARPARRKPSPSLSMAGPIPASSEPTRPANPPPCSPSSWTMAPSSISPPPSTPTAPASLPRWLHAGRSIPCDRHHATGEQRPRRARRTDMARGQHRTSRAAGPCRQAQNQAQEGVVVHQGS